MNQTASLLEDLISNCLYQNNSHQYDCILQDFIGVDNNSQFNSIVSVNERIQNLKSHKYIVSGWLSLIIAIFGIIGNILTISILLKPTMCTITNTFITGLSISDIISLSVVIFLVPVRDILINNYQFDYIYTYLYPNLYPIAATFQFTSIYLMVVTCLSRVISLYFSRRFDLKSIRKCWIIIFIIFVFSAFSCFPLWFYYQTDHIKLDDNYTTIIVLNYTRLSLSHEYRSFVHTYIIVLTNLIPLITLTVSNYYLVGFLYKARVRRHRLGIRERNELVITFILTMFVFLFFVCQLPNFLLHILQAINFHIDIILQMYFRQWATLLLIINSSYSFIIYCCLNSDFRDEAKKIFTFNYHITYMDQYNSYIMRSKRRKCVIKTTDVNLDYKKSKEITCLIPGTKLFERIQILETI